MRVFIGIWFPDDKKNQLKTIQQTVKNNSSKGNFTRTENFHLTLRFIGEVDESQLRFLQRAIDMVVSEHKAFSFVIDGYDQFRRLGSRIVYADVKKSLALEALYQTLEEALAECGFAKEDRPYNPHITMGREVVLMNDFDLKQQSFSPITIEAKSISLIESTNINGVLTYIPRYTKSLQ